MSQPKPYELLMQKLLNFSNSPAVKSKMDLMRSEIDDEQKRRTSLMIKEEEIEEEIEEDIEEIIKK